MIRQINVQKIVTRQTKANPAECSAELAEEVSVLYHNKVKKPLFKDFKIGSGLLLTISDKKHSQGSRTVHETENAPVSLGFNIRHRVRCTLQSAGKRAETFERTPGYYALSYLPDTRCLIETPVEERILGVSIHFSVTAFKKLFDELSLSLDDFFSIRKKTDHFYHQSQFNYETAQILNQITACPYHGVLRSLFFEAKALELVVQVMSDLENKLSSTSVNRQEEERIREAFHILSCQIAAPPSLSELSRKVGLNRNKLNSGFKRLYGGTVFRILREMRLYQARDLLLDSDKSLAEIALLVGYSEQANFTTAFQQMFGKTPLTARREVKVQDS